MKPNRVISLFLGPERSTMIDWCSTKVLRSRYWDNIDTMKFLKLLRNSGTPVVCEKPANADDDSTFECVLIGNLQQVAADYRLPFYVVDREIVNLHLCNCLTTTVENIKKPLTRRFEPSGNYTTHDFTDEMWRAFAVAVYTLDMLNAKNNSPTTV